MPDRTAIYKYLPLALLIAAAGPLAVAFISQYGFGYEPCVLCLYQRVPYWVAMGLGVLAFVLPAPDVRRGIALLAGLAFLTGAGIAFYHVGVEQLWWTSAAPCGASGTVADTQDFLAQLQQKPEKSCGDIDWTLFGISMATYNVGVSLALAAASLFAWRRLNGREAA